MIKACFHTHTHTRNGKVTCTRKQQRMHTIRYGQRAHKLSCTHTHTHTCSTDCSVCLLLSALHWVSLSRCAWLTDVDHVSLSLQWKGRFFTSSRPLLLSLTATRYALIKLQTSFERLQRLRTLKRTRKVLSESVSFVCFGSAEKLAIGNIVKRMSRIRQRVSSSIERDEHCQGDCVKPLSCYGSPLYTSKRKCPNFSPSSKC